MNILQLIHHSFRAIPPVLCLCTTSIGAYSLDDLRKDAEKRTGIRIPVPTPGAVIQGTKSVIAQGGQVLNNAGKEIGIAVGNISNEGGKGIGNVQREINKGIGDVIKTAQKAGKDTEKTIAKTGEDVEKNIAKSGREAEDAAHAIGKYAERTVQGYGKTADNAMKRMREGKFVDAVWHAALDPLQNTEENSALAAQESSLIRTVGQVAASAYGGPQGAAAYAAWLTYKETGSLDAAVRVGLITGATAVAFQASSKMPTDVEYALMRKTIVTAAIGGGAIAAAGGSPEDVKNGFISAGAMVLVQDHYSKVTKHDLDRDSMKTSKDVPAYCAGNTVKDCSPVPKDGKLDRRVPSVGVAGGSGVTGDNSAPMKTISKVPGMQGMSVMHDSWVTDVVPPLLNQPTILPAIYVYYTGTGAPFYGHLQKTAVERAIDKQAAADRGKKAGEPSAKLDTKALAAETETPEVKVRAGTDYTVAYSCSSAKEERNWLVIVNKEPTPFACRSDSTRGKRGEFREIETSFSNKHSCEQKIRKSVKRAVAGGLTCIMQRSGSGMNKV